MKPRTPQLFVRAALALCAVLALGACGKSRRLAEQEAVVVPEWTIIGESVEGRPIEAITLGSGSPRILVIGGIHGNEQEGALAVEQLVERFAYRPDATIRLIRDVNPDGSARGQRISSRGVDLNRNWPAANFKAGHERGESALSEPETAAVYDDIEAFGPDLVIVFHSARAGPYVNFDGPATELAAAFASAAADADGRWRTVADMGYATPGSIGSFFGVDRQMPVLTVEFARGHERDRAALAVFAGLEAVIGDRAPWEAAGAERAGAAASASDGAAQ